MCVFTNYNFIYGIRVTNIVTFHHAQYLSNTLTQELHFRFRNKRGHYSSIPSQSMSLDHTLKDDHNFDWQANNKSICELHSLARNTHSSYINIPSPLTPLNHSNFGIGILTSIKWSAVTQSVSSGAPRQGSLNLANRWRQKGHPQRYPRASKLTKKLKENWRKIP